MPPTDTHISRRILALILLACCVPAVASGSAPRRGSRRPTSHAPAPDLAGTEWLLEDLCGRGVVDGVQSTIAFPETGKVAGNGGCNRYFAAARISGDRIEVQHVASTRMACPPAVLDQEHRFLDALQKAKRLEMDGDTLLIHGAGRAKPLRFTRVTEQGKARGKPVR